MKFNIRERLFRIWDWYVNKATEIKNKDIVEIGCGRGGGLSYITKNFSRASAIGIDLDR